MKNTVVSRIELPALNENTESRAASLGERMDLVEHVSVKLDVLVGQTTLPINRLFALSTGDILALDTLVDAPIEILLNGKLIARGELIAVGDQFGVQITDIAP